MSDKVAGITADAVQNATGAGWATWLERLDARGGTELTHKELVAELDELGVENGWWRQMIAKGYEQERGMRDQGETVDAGYQIGIQRTIHVPQAELWGFLTGENGRRLWLGTFEQALEPGVEYETEEGVVGEIRTRSEGDRLRLTWQPADRSAPTTLQFTLSCPRNDRSKTTLRFHHEHLANATEREAMRDHWKTVLDEIEAALVE
jgi:uncharacterized protein YndB with AHSA1/START domain